MSVNTAVATIPEIPAHLVAYSAQSAEENASAAGGIKAGGWPRITIGGSKFHIRESSDASLITDPNNPQLPKMQLELVNVGHNPAVSKVFFEGDYTEGDTGEPDCSSDDGVTPDDGVPGRQSASCAICKQNVWGSKISKVSGKPVKACSDVKRLVMLRSGDLNGPAYELTITPSALAGWATYVKDLNKRKIPISAVETHVFFDPTVTYPKLSFKFGRYLNAEEVAIVQERKGGDDVELIASPRRTGPQPTAGVIPIHPAPMAPAPAPAPAPAAAAPAPAAPATPPPPADPYAGQPDYVKAAVTAAGGLGTPPGDTTYKSLTGKNAPSASAPATPPPTPPDPYAGQPAHVQPAVTAAGGLGSPGGDATYKALTGKDAPAQQGAVTSPPAPKTGTRGRKAAQPATAPAASPPQQASAPATTAAPAPAPTSYVQAPAGQVATPGAGMDIEAMLTAALETPTGQ